MSLDREQNKTSIDDLSFETDFEPLTRPIYEKIKSILEGAYQSSSRSLTRGHDYTPKDYSDLDWIDRINSYLETKAGKKLWEEIIAPSSKPTHYSGLALFAQPSAKLFKLKMDASKNESITLSYYVDETDSYKIPKTDIIYIKKYDMDQLVWEAISWLENEAGLQKDYEECKREVLRLLEERSNKNSKESYTVKIHMVLSHGRLAYLGIGESSDRNKNGNKSLRHTLYRVERVRDYDRTPQDYMVDPAENIVTDSTEFIEYYPNIDLKHLKSVFAEDKVGKLPVLNHKNQKVGLFPGRIIESEDPYSTFSKTISTTYSNLNSIIENYVRHIPTNQNSEYFWRKFLHIGELHLARHALISMDFLLVDNKFFIEKACECDYLNKKFF